jgi:hypothetical protein
VPASRRQTRRPTATRATAMRSRIVPRSHASSRLSVPAGTAASLPLRAGRGRPGPPGRCPRRRRRR